MNTSTFLVKYNNPKMILEIEQWAIGMEQDDDYHIW